MSYWQIAASEEVSAGLHDRSPMYASLPIRLIAAAACLVVSTSVRAAETPRPNIVVFLVDDMGWQDTSVPFLYSGEKPVPTPSNHKFHTPNMERLAAEGMKFTDAYACPVCTPSRVSLMTGLNAARHRVTNWTFQKDTPTDGASGNLRLPMWNVNGLSLDPSTPFSVHAPTVAQLLRDAGYRTIHAGKAHWGSYGTPGADPLHLGFDVNIGGHAAGQPGSYLGEENYEENYGKPNKSHLRSVPGLDSYHGTETFLTEALTIEANKAVDQALADKKPFFLYMAHYAVHVPYAPDKRFFQKYLDAGLDRTEAMYAALIEGMDKSLGDILEHLEKLGVTSNTVVLFMSDNGGLAAHGRGGPPNTQNAPLSSGKGSAYEGGIREPMIVKWPGVVPPGAVCHRPVIIEDYFPSLLEIAGEQKRLQGVPHIDGVSFLPLLRQDADAAAADRPLFWHYPNSWGPKGPGIAAFSAIRDGNWKLIYYHDGPRYELFNVAEDIGEKNNLIESEKAKAHELAAKLAAWLKATDAQMPANKSTGETVPLPEL